MRAVKTTPVSKEEIQECPWIDMGRGAKLELGDYPSVMLLRLANAIQQELAYKYASEHDLTPSEWRVMARLSKASPMQFAELCRVAAMDKAYVSRMIRSLEERGLVRTEVDPAHKRRLLVSITPDGQAMARRIFPSAQRSQAWLLSALEPNERVVLYTALKKLQALVDTAPAKKPIEEKNADEKSKKPKKK